MTLSKPSIIIKRLIVMKSGCHLYDETFHVGVNIIRGKNSPGKSTIMSFLFYALGGENIKWTHEQNLCDKVFLDIKVSGRDVCLQREVVADSKANIYVHDGSYEQGLSSEVWLKYGRIRSTEKESFSEMLFNMLGLPQHKTDFAANLTMHQILRLMFFDQSTSTSKLLREESFDRKDTRSAIGDYLLGLDNLDGRRIHQQLIGENKKLGMVTGEVTAIHRFLGKATANVKTAIIEENIELMNAEIESKKDILKKIESDSFEITDVDQQKNLDDLIERVKKISIEVSSKERRLQWLTAEAEDNELFLYTLKERVKAINHSTVAEDSFGEIAFKFCPLCLSRIELGGTDEHQCPLCKKEHETSQNTPYTQIITELNFQIRETESVMAQQEVEGTVLSAQLPHLNSLFRQAKAELQSQELCASPKQGAIETLARRIGFLESSIDKERESLKYASKLEAFKEQKGSLGVNIKKLEQLLDELELVNKERDLCVRRNLELRTLTIVEQDLGDEKSFDSPSAFSFDFQKDTYSIDGKDKISDSSMVILKNSFGLSLFIESVMDSQMRLPNFMLFDSIEDKGMRPERSQNFQRIIVEECRQLSGEFQLIMTTSMIAPDLDNSDLCVGPYYDKHNPTLDFSVCE